MAFSGEGSDLDMIHDDEEDDDNDDNDEDEDDEDELEPEQDEVGLVRAAPASTADTPLEAGHGLGRPLTPTVTTQTPAQDQAQVASDSQSKRVFQ